MSARRILAAVVAAELAFGNPAAAAGRAVASDVRGPSASPPAGAYLGSQLEQARIDLLGAPALVSPQISSLGSGTESSPLPDLAPSAQATAAPLTEPAADLTLASQVLERMVGLGLGGKKTPTEPAREAAAPAPDQEQPKGGRVGQARAVLGALSGALQHLGKSPEELSRTDVLELEAHLRKTFSNAAPEAAPESAVVEPGIGLGRRLASWLGWRTPRPEPVPDASAELDWSLGRYRADPEFRPEQMFSPEDALFLEHGNVDVLSFMERRFPALKAALEIPYGPGDREYATGFRDRNIGRALLRGFQVLESALAQEAVPELPGVRMRAVLRAVLAAAYTGLMPAFRVHGGDPRPLQRLRAAGFQIPSAASTRKRHQVDAWGAISSAVLSKMTTDLRFTPRESALAAELLREIPKTTDGTSVSELAEYAAEGKLKDFQRYHPRQAEEIRKRARALGIPPSVLYRVSLWLLAARSGMQPAELRALRREGGIWRVRADLRAAGLADLADIADGKESGAVPPALSAYAKRGRELARAPMPPPARPIVVDGRLDPDALVLVHARHDLPDEQGRMHPNIRYGEGSVFRRNPRTVLEFSWNGVIDQWNDADVVVLTPLAAALKRDADGGFANLWYTATTYVGSYALPPGSTVLLREGAALPKGRAEALERLGIRVVRFPKERTSSDAAQEVLERQGYAAMTLGTDFYEGGEGTDTTWMDARRGGADLFDPDHVGASSDMTRELARGYGLSGEGKRSFPLGRLISDMEEFHENFASTGLVHRTYGKLSELEMTLARFERDLKAVEAGPRAGAWRDTTALARAYLELGRFEAAVSRSVVPDGDDRRVEDFWMLLSRELHRQPGRVLTRVVAELNARFGLRVRPESIRDEKGFVELMTRVADSLAPGLGLPPVAPAR